MELYTSLIYLLLIYMLLSMSLNLAMGYAGILSIGHAVFYGVGAYTATLSSYTICELFTYKENIPLFPFYIICIFIAVCSASILGAFTALFTIQLKADFFLVATLAFGYIFQEILRNMSWSGGNLGLKSIPNVIVFDHSVSHGKWAVVLALSFVFFVYWVCGRIEKSPFGLSLYALSQDETLAITTGESPLSLKVRALTISAGIAGLAGALAAPFYNYIDPGFFGLNESILIFAMVLFGGIGKRNGACLGALVLIVVPVLLLFLRLPSYIDANVRQILYGMILILLVKFRPFGLTGRNFEL